MTGYEEQKVEKLKEESINKIMKIEDEQILLRVCILLRLLTAL